MVQSFKKVNLGSKRHFGDCIHGFFLEGLNCSNLARSFLCTFKNTSKGSLTDFLAKIVVIFDILIFDLDEATHINFKVLVSRLF
jgi:hypothetical protein